MRQYPPDPEIAKIWKIYPVRIPGRSIAPCHNEQTVLVQSMDGGFVTRNCPRCGNAGTLPEDVFEKLDLWVACPQCKARMTRQMVRKN
jgi:ribosomal protein S27E